MSWNPAHDPNCPESPAHIDTVIIPRARDLGGFVVRRALPAPKRQMVGPFIFFDQMGPAELVTGIDVRPHPHIGLATVTYLLEGEIGHKDSLGSDTVIRPNEVNWMVAGRGITHSERTPDHLRGTKQNLFGIQTWIALPEHAEETDPAFQHVGEADLPVLEDGGAKVRLILGSAYGESVDVKTFSEMFYADAQLRPNAKLALPRDHEDRGLHILDGSIQVAGETFDTGQMVVFHPGDDITVKAGESGARFVTLGGETLNGPRYIWWNFVSSNKERIDDAKQAWRTADWENGPFTLPPADSEEFIPLD